ncbi:MAG: hypothetical protein KKH67_04755 [candidate division Zixibacteria bacterium]|nr:hypothetical protein [candidate division Zixibacteria bacterium]MBU1469545.1 hypothetical protein [candidate division Zixibacteria bacterium]
MTKRTISMVLAITIVLLTCTAVFADEALEALQPNQEIAAFAVDNLYDNDAAIAIGARFHHVPSGMILDVLRIQSVPQAYMWFNSFPDSDKGEPHTCEHLLLGKGNKGRYVSSLENMSLGSSSAGTYTLHTDYHFNTTAGGDVFYELLEAKLDAMLYPNFSDEEIRREVCNMGVVDDPETSTLSLEEKGTVYTEMVSTFERAGTILWYDLAILMYGKGHPCSNESGGTPEGIRSQIPEDLRKFHGESYLLSNMGMIVCLPDEYGLEDFLRKTSDILEKLDPNAEPGPNPGLAEDNLPAPKPAPAGTTKFIEFPHLNENEPGILTFAWPPTQKFDNNEKRVADLLLDNLASGQTSNLHKKFIDSQTRVMDIGTNGIYVGFAFDFGLPIYLWFSNVSRESLNENTIDSVRSVVRAELEKIANFADGSEELKSFNDRVLNRIAESKRYTRKFVSTPPRFGYRSIGNEWADLLKRLQTTDGFRKDLMQKQETEFAENLIKSGRNFWKEYIDKCKLLEFEPYAIAAVANPELLEKDKQTKQARIAEYVDGLKTKYGVSSDQEAISLCKADYDAKTAEIEEDAKKIDMPTFVEQPPMALDGQLNYTVSKMPGGGQMVVSTFETMTGTNAGLVFGMEVVPEEYLVYVPALPTFLNEVGVIENGVPIAYDEMSERIRQEILWVNASYSTRYAFDRAELVIAAAGSDMKESERAIEWMKLVLLNPDWRIENLPRIRDAIDLRLSNSRNTMKGSEERWVSGPAAAYRKQSNPLLMSAGCFLTQNHALQRVRWMLKEAGSASVNNEVSGFLSDLGAVLVVSDRAGAEVLLSDVTAETPKADNALREKFDALTPDARILASEAVKDLTQNLHEVPDATLGADLDYICRQIDADLSVPPEKALTDLKNMMEFIRRQDNVRSYAILNSSIAQTLLPKIEETVSGLSNAASAVVHYSDEPLVKSRLAERNPKALDPVYVGLINENTQNGVFLNSARSAGYLDFDDESLLDFLAAQLYAGGGAHSMFMKTWGAGLAYSNGIGTNSASGLMSYYAERCPDLAQTIQFVADELKNAPNDPSLANYAVAQVFRSSRAASNYEDRGTAMATDLADGLTPEVVKRFRESVLELSKAPDLYDRIQSRMLATYGEVVPGLDPPGRTATDAVYFIIGPETQFQSFEEYLSGTEGKTDVYRLYPRDFWIVGSEAD